MKFQSFSNTGGRFRVLTLLFTDFFGLYGLLIAALFVYQQIGGQYPMIVCLHLWGLPVMILICNACARVYGGSLFYPGAGVNPIEELRRLTLSITAGYLLLFAFLSLSRTSESFTRAGLVGGWFLSILLLPVFRYFTRSLLKKFDAGMIPVIIAGAGLTGTMLHEELKKDRFYGFRVIGFLDDNPDRARAPVLGPIHDAIPLAKERSCTYLITCMPLPEVNRRINAWLHYFHYVLIVPDNRVFPIMWAYPVNLYGFSGLEIGNRLRRKLFRIGKLVTECVLSFLAIVCLLPLFCLLALAVKLTSPGPIFYRAERLGQNGKKIRVLKFRTMYRDADKKLAKLLAENPDLAAEWAEKFKLDNDPRITPLGKFLRKTSLDELPQFWNVLRGEMSVIGPRPIVEKEVAYYGEHYEVFSRVKPGITGLWQVSGRSETTYERRVALDVYYINNWSVWLDYYIFLKTIKEVLMRTGAK